MIALYSAAMTLLVAGTFGIPGYIAWGFCWAAVVFRHTSKPRRTVAPLTTGDEASDA